MKLTPANPLLLFSLPGTSAQRLLPWFPHCCVTSDDAAAMSEPTAALTTLQRHAPSLPPAKSVNSAPIRELPARQCSGNLPQPAQP
ncbi:MAG: hypothetical protein R3E39_27920 [Anaerolineae bacterium]